MAPFARPAAAAVLALLLAGTGAATSSADAQSPSRPRLQTAVFAGGCFWSEEKAFDGLPGVRSAVSGFVGGHTANPTYEQVVRGGTGHMEAVRVTFDSSVVSYRALADRYWRTIELPGRNGGPSGNAIVLGQVVGVHIADEAIVDGKVDVTRLKPIARLGYGDYAVIDEVFTLPRRGA